MVECDIRSRNISVGVGRRALGGIDADGGHFSLVQRTHILQYRMPGRHYFGLRVEAGPMAHRHRHRPMHQLRKVRGGLQGIMHRPQGPRGRQFAVRQLLQLPDSLSERRHLLSADAKTALAADDAADRRIEDRSHDPGRHRCRIPVFGSGITTTQIII